MGKLTRFQHKTATRAVPGARLPRLRQLANWITSWRLAISLSRMIRSTLCTGKDAVRNLSFLLFCAAVEMLTGNRKLREACLMPEVLMTLGPCTACLSNLSVD